MSGRELTHPARSREAARRTDGGGVSFLDAAGVYWRVTERDARHDPGARGDRCLIFDCDQVVRRVWDYPAGWRALPVEELIALSWRR